MTRAIKRLIFPDDYEEEIKNIGVEAARDVLKKVTKRVRRVFRNVKEGQTR